MIFSQFLNEYSMCSFIFIVYCTVCVEEFKVGIISVMNPSQVHQLLISDVGSSGQQCYFRILSGLLTIKRIGFFDRRTVVDFVFPEPEITTYYNDVSLGLQDTS